MSQLNETAGQPLALTPVRSKEQLLGQLLAAVQNGVLRVGDRLMNEREMAEVSSLSRTTVRSALQQLERQGVIERQVGRGTFVKDLPSAVQMENIDPMSLVSPAEVIEFRLGIEPAIVDLLVHKISDYELDRIYALLDNAPHATSYDEIERSDRDFHHMLYAATQNSLFAETGRKISLMRNNPAWLRLKERNFSPDTWPTFIKEHRAILDALRMRDAALAKHLIRTHIAGVSDVYRLRQPLVFTDPDK